MCFLYQVCFVCRREMLCHYLVPILRKWMKYAVIWSAGWWGKWALQIWAKCQWTCRMRARCYCMSLLLSTSGMSSISTLRQRLKYKVCVLQWDIWTCGLLTALYDADLGQWGAGTDYAHPMMSLASLLTEVTQTSSSRCLNALLIPSSCMTHYADEIYRFDDCHMLTFSVNADIRYTDL